MQRSKSHLLNPALHVDGSVRAGKRPRGESNTPDLFLAGRNVRRREGDVLFAGHRSQVDLPTEERAVVTESAACISVHADLRQPRVLDLDVQVDEVLVVRVGVHHASHVVRSQDADEELEPHVSQHVLRPEVDGTPYYESPVSRLARRISEHPTHEVIQWPPRVLLPFPLAGFGQWSRHRRFPLLVGIGRGQSSWQRRVVQRGMSEELHLCM